MDRCHLYLPLVDSSGAPYSFAEVTLLDDEGQPIEEPVYLQSIGGAPQIWPVLLDPAVINLWTEKPMRVTVQAALPGGATLTRAGVDIAPAPTATVRTTAPLQMGPSDGLDGSAMLAVSPDGRALWQVLDVLRFHRHEGDAPDSVMLGVGDLTDVYPRQVWIGDGAGGVGSAQGSDTVALGASSVITGGGSVSLGGATAGPEAVAAGTAAQAGGDGVALGSAASADGSSQTALGGAANATPGQVGAVVAGHGATVDAQGTLNLGGAVTIGEDGTTTVGTGPAPLLDGIDAAGAVILRGDVVAPQYLGVRGDAVVGGAASPLSFYASPGGYQPLLDSTGAGSPPPAFTSLMQALDQLGLVYRTDGALQDELADWSLTTAHDANLVLTTDDGANHDGDTNRAKCSASAPGSVTYQLTDNIRDFSVRVFAWRATDASLAASVVAEVSPDGTAWTAVPVGLTPLTATVGGWAQARCTNAATLPQGSLFLRLTIDNPFGRDNARNIALNPSMTTDLANTSGYGANISRYWDDTQAHVGSSCMRMHHNGTTIAGSSWLIEPVTGGQTIQAGIWVKLPPGKILRGNLSWLDLSTGYVTLNTQPITMPPDNGEWTLISGSYTLATGELCDHIGLSFEPVSADTEWYADAVMVEVGDTLHDYVDGYQPSCSWEGTPDASPSSRSLSAFTPQLGRVIVRSRPGLGAGLFGAGIYGGY